MKGRKTPHCVRAVDRRSQSSSVPAVLTDGTAVENVRYVAREEEERYFYFYFYYQVEDWDEHADECSG